MDCLGVREHLPLLLSSFCSVGYLIAAVAETLKAVTSSFHEQMGASWWVWKTFSPTPVCLAESAKVTVVLFYKSLQNVFFTSAISEQTIQSPMETFCQVIDFTPSVCTLRVCCGSIQRDICMSSRGTLGRPGSVWARRRAEWHDDGPTHVHQTEVSVVGCSAIAFRDWGVILCVESGLYSTGFPPVLYRPGGPPGFSLPPARLKRRLFIYFKHFYFFNVPQTWYQRRYCATACLPVNMLTTFATTFKRHVTDKGSKNVHRQRADRAAARWWGRASAS